MKAQADAQNKQVDAQVKMAEMQVKQQQAQIDSVIERMRLDLEAKDVQIRGQKVIGDQSIAEAKEAFSQKLEIVLANQEQQRIEMEKVTSALHASEAMLEEERLTKQAMLDLVEHQVNLKIAALQANAKISETMPKEKAQAAPPIHIHMGGEKESSYEYDDKGRVIKSRTKSK